VPTLNQLVISKCRRKKLRKDHTKALVGCPQKSGFVVKYYYTSPKKPNSAIRKVAKVRLCTRRQIIVGVPGLGSLLKANTPVLIRGGRFNDVPGVKYKPIKGVLGFHWAERIERHNRRSKFGAPTLDKKFTFLKRSGPTTKDLAPNVKAFKDRVSRAL